MLCPLKSNSHQAFTITTHSQSTKRKRQMELIIHGDKLNNNGSVEMEKYFSYSLQLRGGEEQTAEDGCHQLIERVNKLTDRKNKRMEERKTRAEAARQEVDGGWKIIVKIYKQDSNKAKKLSLTTESNRLAGRCRWAEEEEEEEEDERRRGEKRSEIDMEKIQTSGFSHR